MLCPSDADAHAQGALERNLRHLRSAVHRVTHSEFERERERESRANWKKHRFAKTSATRLSLSLSLSSRFSISSRVCFARVVLCVDADGCARGDEIVQVEKGGRAHGESNGRLCHVGTSCRSIVPTSRTRSASVENTHTSVQSALDGIHPRSNPNGIPNGRGPNALASENHLSSRSRYKSPAVGPCFRILQTQSAKASAGLLCVSISRRLCTYSPFASRPTFQKRKTLVQSSRKERVAT